MSQQTTKSPIFDQIVKGNVSIKKLSEYRYRITFSKIGKFLLYQVWDKDSKNLNKKRKVGYVSAKTWVTVRKNNEKLEEKGKPLFTPTTIMETEDDCVYAFVIHKAYINSCGHVVFTVSTKEISLQNNTSKKLVRLPCGKSNNARFDIDSREEDEDGGSPISCIDYSTFSPINSDILGNIEFTYTKLAPDSYNLTYTDNNINKNEYTYTGQPLNTIIFTIKNIKSFICRSDCRYQISSIDLGIGTLGPTNITGGTKYLDSPSLRFIIFSNDQKYFYVDVDQNTGTVTYST